MKCSRINDDVSTNYKTIVTVKVIVIMMNTIINRSINMLRELLGYIYVLPVQR